MTTTTTTATAAAAAAITGDAPMFSVETRGELHPFVNQEFILTNGAGAMAGTTLVGCNTRRYHGLLCAATVPPVGRVMALNRVGELLFVDGRRDFQELSVNQFRHNVHPRGDRFLRRFTLGRAAAWEFEVEGVKVRKELQLLYRRNVIGLRYTIDPGADGERPFELHLLPFVSLRDFHALLLAAHATPFEVRADGWLLTVNRNQHTLHLRADAGEFAAGGEWWYAHTYPVETERGQDDTEDLFQPGRLVFKGRGASRLTVWASLDEPAELHDWDEELRRRPDPVPANSVRPAADPAPDGDLPAPAVFHPLSAALFRLARAADDFVVARRQPDGSPGTTVIAGYPWFADWGRDTMISLPGLLLATRRFEEAAQVLSLFAQFVSQGMIPNRFDDYSNEPHYNTVDASLWFVHAAFEYARLSGDRQTFESKLRPACRQVLDGYRAGTRYHIRMDEADGLISAGDEQTQLTWMDAKCDGVAFTPRHGKAVEINALWYHALRLMGEDALADRVREGFVRAFWYNPFRGLYDVVYPDGRRDAAIRPNQIFAVSLPHSPLSAEQQHAVVEVVRRELFTPYGLRTLYRGDPNYHGRYGGPAFERDKAYHNGVVWPWLMGPFLEAYLRVHRFDADSQRQARVWLQPLLDHLNVGCVGQVSECFTGDEPHWPVGAPAQAWSVAELLRLAAILKL